MIFESFSLIVIGWFWGVIFTVGVLGIQEYIKKRPSRLQQSQHLTEMDSSVSTKGWLEYDS